MNRQPHILVVDDDREIRRLLCDFLERNGFAATAVADGQETRRTLGQARFDLVVLDLMLPRESGLDICREVRATSDLPVIMLTALGDEVDRVVGFEVGADDYLTKPFSPRELLARIRAVLRRVAQRPRCVEADALGYRFAEWYVDATARSLTHTDGTVAALSGAEYRLLSVLLEHAPRLLTRAQLLDLVSGRDFDPFDRSIDVRVSRLRQTLRDDARAPRIIKTVYGEGYIIGVPVERSEARP